MHRPTFGIAALAVLAACGGEQPPAASPQQAAPSTTESTTTTTTTTAVETTWSRDMPKEHQVAFMKTRVVPAMRPVFFGADASRYADFGCATCHGPEFKVPSDHLPRLTLKDGQITAFADKPAVAKFMAESVVSKMASAMGMAPYDPKTGKGFGCAGCHAVDMK
jgi:hypothetical protein